LPNRRPTIDDVAALSGVARVTVSRVLNGGPNVRPQVREKVMAAVEALQYRVNVQAQRLAARSSWTLAMVVEASHDAEPNSFYHSGLEIGALRACADAGFQLQMHPFSERAEGDADVEILALAASGQVDGLVLTPPFSDRLELLRQLHAARFPVACISAGPQARQAAPSVRMDEERAGFDITRHLLELGHRRFAFMKGLTGHLAAEERYAGFLKALDGAGLDEQSVVSARGDFTFRSGAALTPELVQAELHPTALICANDDMAVGAMFAAHRMGLAIPAQLSVVGFDDTPVSAIIWPPLTTVHQPLKRMGARAVELLVGQVRKTQEHGERTEEIIPHQLMTRDSTIAIS
jgi:LacI family transcriptional regulator